MNFSRIGYRLRRAWAALVMPVPRSRPGSASWRDWRLTGSLTASQRCLLDVPVVEILSNGARVPVKLDLPPVTGSPAWMEARGMEPFGWDLEDWKDG